MLGRAAVDGREKLEQRLITASSGNPHLRGFADGDERTRRRESLASSASAILAAIASPARISGLSNNTSISVRSRSRAGPPIDGLSELMWLRNAFSMLTASLSRATFAAFPEHATEPGVARGDR